VIEALTNKQHVSPYLDTTAVECTKLHSSFNYISFTHVRRVSNQTTHYLAKFTPTSNSYVVWINRFNESIFPFKTKKLQYNLEKFLFPFLLDSFQIFNRISYFLSKYF